MTAPRPPAWTGEVDWTEVRRRVEEAGRALVEGGHSPERDRAVLESRARDLARAAAPEPAESERELVTFTLAGERFAIDARYLLAVARADRITTLPGADPTDYGVMAWRGELLFVRDYRVLLGLPSDPGAVPGFVLVVGEDRPAFGILAEEAGELVCIPASQVHLAPGGDGPGRSIVHGVTGGMLVVLDAMEPWNLHG